jgi:hypothetical protein
MMKPLVGALIYFGIIQMAWAAGPVKVDRNDFVLSPAILNEEFILPAGERLNVVFDLFCLANAEVEVGETTQAREQVPKNLIERTRRFKTRYSNQYSVSWILERSVSLATLKELAESDVCIVQLAPDREITIQAASPTGDPDGSVQEHLIATRWNSAYGRFAGFLQSYRPIIAVIDTGTEIAHPDLKQNIWVNSKEIANNEVDDDGNGFVDDVNGYNFGDKNGNPNPQSNDSFFFHGTHVAGLIAARAGNGVNGTGIHGYAQILPINAFGSDRSARVSTIENAIRYAVDNGATIINLSVGGSEFSSTMLETLRYATSKGVFIVTAAGNEGVELSPNSSSSRFKSPAIYGRRVQGMLTVTSVDIQGGRLSTFSNYGMFYVELAAPGAVVSTNGSPTGLLSTMPGASMGRLAGTSMAAPLVSGAVAVMQSWLKAHNRPTTPASIEAILLAGSRANDSLLGITRSGKVLDFQILMDRLEGRTSPVIDGGHLSSRSRDSR